MVGIQALTISGPDIPEFLYLGVCQANNLQCSCYNIQHLKQPIRQPAVSVTADVLGRVWQEMEYR
jgi:hypothetical protein